MHIPRSLLAGIALFLGAGSAFSQSPALQNGDVVAICGDSITEQKLYSLFMEDYLLMCQPAEDLQAMQFGWSGEKAPEFLARMKYGVLPFKPTVATVCYGMNDGGYRPLSDEWAGYYRRALTEIVKTFQGAGVRMVVLSGPGAVDTATYKKNVTPEVYNKTLADLSAIAKEVADKNQATYTNLHEVMADVMAKAKAKFGDAYHVAGGDGIHPAANGHLVMAYVMLKALGCSGDIGTITYDFQAGKAEATTGHKILSADKSAINVESTRYPFCFTGGKPIEDPSSPVGVLEFLPFNQDLNRFLLVVKNAPPKIKVTWGEASKEFTAEQAAAGINLAAEFLMNPFFQPFSTVQDAIKKQQNFETPAVKSMLNSLKDWTTYLPEEAAFVQGLTEKVVAKDVQFRQEARAAIKPVTHMIKIEAVN